MSIILPNLNHSFISPVPVPVPVPFPVPDSGSGSGSGLPGFPYALNKSLARCLFVESVWSTLSKKFYLWLFLTQIVHSKQ